MICYYDISRAHVQYGLRHLNSTLTPLPSYTAFIHCLASASHIVIYDFISQLGRLGGVRAACHSRIIRILKTIRAGLRKTQPGRLELACPVLTRDLIG